MLKKKSGAEFCCVEPCGSGTIVQSVHTRLCATRTNKNGSPDYRLRALGPLRAGGQAGSPGWFVFVFPSGESLRFAGDGVDDDKQTTVFSISHRFVYTSVGLRTDETFPPPTPSHVKNFNAASFLLHHRRGGWPG